MNCDCISVMGATGYFAIFVVLGTYIGANTYCHLIGRDDENILSSCIDQSDDTIHLLRYMHSKQQRWPCIRLQPSHKYNHTSFKKRINNETMNFDQS